jgi:ribosomal protein S6--L-glutamate ligase/tetrahydromethanopterin:alpha-L-glutamate ligase
LVIDLKIGLLTRNEKAWCSSKVKQAFVRNAVEPFCFSFSNLSARVEMHPQVSLGEADLLKELSALLVRPIGRGSLDEIIFQLNILHKLARNGLPVVNSPASIEKGADKYYTLALLSENNLPVPKTFVTEDVEEALKAFQRFGGDAVVKPVFGSRGIGAARISDLDIAERAFRTLRFYRHVIYIQEFVPHGTRDIRSFVVGNRVIAAMMRVSSSWKTNVSRGAKPVPLSPTSEIEELTVKAAKTIGCEIAGVDLLESKERFLINEINSQPGWKGLQTTTKIDIADEIARFVIAKARR